MFAPAKSGARFFAENQGQNREAGTERTSAIVSTPVQRMSVTVDGEPRYNWRVSTARRGYITPPGTYHPEMLARSWFSRKYYNSPMPHSIFFYGGFAIHGSYEISHLGRPASHGCVRLDPANATILFGLVQREGMAATTIVIH